MPLFYVKHISFNCFKITGILEFSLHLTCCIVHGVCLGLAVPCEGVQVGEQWVDQGLFQFITKWTVQAMSKQFLQENTEENSVKCFTKMQVKSIHNNRILNTVVF